MDAVTAVEFYQAPLSVVAFFGGWVAAMVTGIMFRSAS